jgi:hypothetical protein
MDNKSFDITGRDISFVIDDFSAAPPLINGAMVVCSSCNFRAATH